MNKNRYQLLPIFLGILVLISMVPLAGVQVALAAPQFAVSNIDTGEEFETIQQAIDDRNTLDGHTILIGEGIYYENLVVNKSISLVGEDRSNTTIDGSGLDTVIDVSASYVTITNLTIQNAGPGYGIYLHNPSQWNVISRNIVRNSSVGIWLNASDFSTVLRNSCSNNDFDGIFLRNSNRNTISENIVWNNAFGIWIEMSRYNSISLNKAFNNSNSGLYVKASDSNQLTYNVVLDEPFGFWIEESERNTFSNNYVSCGPESYAFTLIDSSDNIIIRNSASGNFLGVRLDQDSSENRIFHNNFFSNNLTLRGSSHNFLDNGVEGNYWSDYNGTDNNQDGIGDTPYVKNANNTDYYPLIEKLSDLEIDLGGEKQHVYAVGNCSIFGLRHNASSRTIRFTVDGLNGTEGFCRVVIPKLLISFEPYVVLIDGIEADASLLPASSVTHAVFYFTFNFSTHEVMILSRQYFELLARYGSLLEDLRNLESSYENLSVTCNLLLGNVTELLESLDSLQDAYDDLSAQYTSLNSTYTDEKSRSTRELNNIRIVLYAFMAVAILGTFVFLPIGAKYYRTSSAQRKIIQAYSPFEIASALFRTDAERRRLKIEKFEEKYGLKITPRGTLEEVMRGFEEKRKVKR